MDEKPKRRWFSFSLRTMFVVVTIFGVWLGWQLKIVRERKAVLAEIKRTEKSQFDDDYIGLESEFDPDDRVDLESARISFGRRLLGDESCLFLALPKSLDPQWIERAEAAFPEAEIWMSWPEGGVKHLEWRDSLCKPAKDREPNVGTIFKTGLIEK